MHNMEVFRFADHRKFLAHVRDHYPGRKSPIPLSIWSQRLGYKSPRSIAMVLKGQRLPTPEMITALAGELRLSAQESRYLELLVEKTRRKRAGRDLASLENEIKKVRPQAKLGRRILKPIELSYFADWSHFVMKQLAASPLFQEDAGWIARRLRSKLNTLQVRRSLEILLHHGVLEREPATGKLKLKPGSSLFSDNDVPSEAIRLHHKQMMKRASEALDEQSVAEREFLTLTLRVDPKNLGALKRALRKFRDDFEDQFHSEAANSVHQLNIQFFEHTQGGLK
jgi:uncharacterized protein (TIGR02147 family)